ncbi:luciferin sulfotransferase-like isoform X3 [Clytia hemisphaerica]|uniref:luciferin sulfotransferase-like isoform X3 n=1 Tax=Clytia hemisphaerica TaxID=252671 RepID=UPI0034D7231E
MEEYHSETLESKFFAPFANIPYVSNVHYARPSDVFIPKGYFQNIEEIKNFKFFEDDTVICGFLKTGTNWCERIVWALRNDIKLNIQHAPPVSVFDIVMGIGDFDSDNNKAHDEIFSSMKRPRVIKMHLTYELLPRQFQQKQPKEGHSSTVEAAHKGKTMFNKGQAGSWKVLFTPAMTKQMEEWESKWLRDTDLELIYE